MWKQAWSMMGPGHVSHGDAQRRKQGDWKDLLEEIPSYLSLGKKQVARLWLVQGEEELG